MKNRVIFLVSRVILMIALLFMCINWLWVSLPDWAVRMIGIVLLVDLVVLVSSTVRMKHKDNV